MGQLGQLRFVEQLELGRMGLLQRELFERVPGQRMHGRADGQRDVQHVRNAHAQLFERVLEFVERVQRQFVEPVREGVSGFVQTFRQPEVRQLRDADAQRNVQHVHGFMGYGKLGFLHGSGRLFAGVYGQPIVRERVYGEQNAYVFVLLPMGRMDG